MAQSLVSVSNTRLLMIKRYVNLLKLLAYSGDQSDFGAQTEHELTCNEWFAETSEIGMILKPHVGCLMGDAWRCLPVTNGTKYLPLRIVCSLFFSVASPPRQIVASTTDAFEPSSGEANAHTQRIGGQVYGFFP